MVFDHILRRDKNETAFKDLGLRPGDYLLTNSYVHHHKNVPMLFEALSGQPDLLRKLVLFGSSTEKDFIQKGIVPPPEVRFLGRVPDELLRTLMENAAIFLWPSRTEGFGLPPLEAMLLKCPTISSSGGGDEGAMWRWGIICVSRRS